MKPRILNIIAFCFVLIIIVSCDRPQCTNTNPIFEHHNVESNLYKEELAKQLNLVDRSKLTYWLQKYEERGGQEYLHFYIQGGGLCAILVVTVNQWNKLEDVREKKGVSYRGAKFTNLQFDIEQNASNTVFIYKDFGRIID